MPFVMSGLRQFLDRAHAVTGQGTFLKLRLLANSRARQDARYRTADWARKNYPEMKRLMANHTRAGQPDAVCKVFCYWGQGFENAPAIVQACHRRMIQLHGAENVVSLHDGNLQEFVKMPSDVHENGKNNRTAFSDLLRVALLAQNGGMWVDATVFCRENLYEVLPDIRGGGYFAFSQIGRKARISSWFMYSDRNHYIPALLEKAMLIYWQQNRPVRNYFMLYDIFESLYFLDKDFRDAWNAVVPLDRKAPRQLHPLFFNDFDQQSFKAIWDGAFLHKLTYKLKSQPGSGTMLAHLLSTAADKSGRA